MWNFDGKRGRSGALRGWVLAALGATLLQTGCDESLTAPATENAATAPITIGALRESVVMTDAQAAELGDALADLERAQRARRNEPGGGPAPHLEFLARASRILDREQMLALVRTLADHQQERASGRAQPWRDGAGPGGHDPRHVGPGMRRHGSHGGRDGHVGPGRGALPGLIGELDLSAEQQQAVRDAARVLHETMRALREQRRNGALSDAEFRTAAAAAHTQFETTVAGILTAEQNARWQELQRTRAALALEQAIARIRAHQDRHLELLAEILGLDQAQRAGFAAIGAGKLADMEALLQRLRDGSIDAAGARGERERIHAETRDAMRALLTAEQAALFDALRALLHRRHGPMP